MTLSAALVTVLLGGSPDAGSPAPQCTRDAQCIVVFHEPEDCCACQPGAAFALPRTEVSKRSRRCAAMGACDCGPRTEQASPTPSPEMRATCREGRCLAVPVETKPGAARSKH